MVIAKKIRLDALVSEQLPQYSRQQIQSWIMQGKVYVDGVPVTKPGTQVHKDISLSYNIEEPKYVSRAGLKLEKALQHFELDVTGMRCLDAGISTGGFTDCLLQHGAEKVYGIDVGYGQVHEKVRVNDRVVILERTNLRSVTKEMLGDPVDLVTLDLSFISVLKVIDAVVKCMKSNADLIVLIKPQFEAQRKDVSRGGIIKDSSVHDRVIKTVTDGIIAQGFICKGVTESPILGGSGNKEFLAHFKRVLQ